MEQCIRCVERCFIMYPPLQLKSPSRSGRSSIIDDHDEACHGIVSERRPNSVVRVYSQLHSGKFFSFIRPASYLAW
jgi:hypothetical protein